MAEKRPADSNNDEPSAKRACEGRKIRIWTDGCFDMMHYGHANALRQSKALGDYLIVGVHSDEEITQHKGPPVMNEQERYRAVRACKWVDEVVEAAPYQTQLSTLEQHDIDWCVHGDDIVTTADGEDCYSAVKRAGKFQTIPRTRGVSTTDLVGRMLLLTKEHFCSNESLSSDEVREFQKDHGSKSPYTRLSQFIPTTSQIVQFSDDRAPKPGDKIIYIDGAFDLFHVGHIAVLEKAKAMGDFLIVGVHSDQEVNRIRGSNFPIMNLHERVLGVLSCRFVDEVIIGAPYAATEQLIRQQNISVVVHGTQTVHPTADGLDPFAVPKQLGIYQSIQSDCDLQTIDIINRIVRNRLAYEERNRKKEAKEVSEIESTTQ